MLASVDLPTPPVVPPISTTSGRSEPVERRQPRYRRSARRTLLRHQHLGQALKGSGVDLAVALAASRASIRRASSNARSRLIPVADSDCAMRPFE